MKITGVYILLFFLLSSFYATPQKQHLVFKTIDINDGLSQNSVVDIVEDSTGFIWFATQDGLNRYDASNFIVFPLTFDDITSPEDAQLGKLLVRNNGIWMITKGGKIRVLNLFTQKISSFSNAGNKNELLPPASYIFEDSRQGLWIGTLDHGLFLLDKRNMLQNYSTAPDSPKKIISNKIRSIFEDRDHQIWILTDAGITKFSEEYSKDVLTGVNANVMTEAPNKTLWLGTLRDGIYLKKKNSLNFIRFTGYKSSPVPTDLVVECIYADSKGRIWVGTYGNGLFVIYPALQKISHFMPDRSTPSGISFQDVLSITEDRSGGIWIGTDGGGVNYYNGLFSAFGRLTVTDVEPGVSIQQIRAVTIDDKGILWLGTSGQGYTSLHPLTGHFETFHLEPFKPGIRNYDRVVSLMSDRENDLWIGTQGNGLLVMDKNSMKIKKWFNTEAESEKQRIPDNTIWVMIPGRDNQVWMATRNHGLLLLDKEKGLLQNYEVPSKGKSVDRNLQALIQIDPATLALGFEEKGVHLFNITTEQFTAVTNPVIKKLLNGETGIKSLYHEEGWLWIGTAGRGIIITNLQTGTTRVLNDKEWLPNNMIYSILPGRKGTVWISSNKGLFRLVYEYGPEEVNIMRIFPFTVEHGLQSNEFNTGAADIAPDGSLCFGGINGLNYFHPKEIAYNQEELNVVITGGKTGNEQIKGDTVITYKNSLDLRYQENSLSFNYTLLDFVSAENLHYQYKLEGYDEEWVEAGNRKYVAYTNLPPDDYRFMVRVSDKISERTPVTSLGISIAAPFWRQWWFLFLVASSIAAFIYGLHRYRIYQILEVQQVKNNISADLHDDLGARLTNIHFLSALFKQKLRLGENNLKYLDEIEGEVEASARSLDEIVWNIKMNDESLEEIVSKMRKYASAFLEAGCESIIKTKGNFVKKKMSMQKRREIFLIFKELLNNIRKHSGATQVEINIAVIDKMFYLEIKDNGCGFCPEKETQRNGLRIIRERVKKWKGVTSIESAKNKGSRISIKIPFDHSWRLTVIMYLVH